MRTMNLYIYKSLLIKQPVQQTSCPSYPLGLINTLNVPYLIRRFLFYYHKHVKSAYYQYLLISILVSKSFLNGLIQRSNISEKKSSRTVAPREIRNDAPSTQIFRGATVLQLKLEQNTFYLPGKSQTKGERRRQTDIGKKKIDRQFRDNMVPMVYV